MQLPFPILHGFALQRFSFRQELVINCTYMLHISIIIFSDHYIHIHKYTIGVQKVFCNVLFAVEMLFIYRCRSIYMVCRSVLFCPLSFWWPHGQQSQFVNVFVESEISFCVALKHAQGLLQAQTCYHNILGYSTGIARPKLTVKSS